LLSVASVTVECHNEISVKDNIIFDLSALTTMYSYTQRASSDGDFSGVPFMYMQLFILLM